jgi:hypothetical protein
MSPAITQLSVTFIPLDFVTEWARCGQTADYLARFLACDFQKRDVVANVFSSVINELVENATKFSADKNAAVTVSVCQFEDCVSIATCNSATLVQAESFRELVGVIMRGDAETLFAERIATPPQIGGAGIGLIVLRKDYGARLEVRLDPGVGGDPLSLHTTVTLTHREVEQL